MKAIRIVLGAVLAGLVAGCAAFPAVGPTADVIDSGSAERARADYEVFDISPSVLASLARYRPVGLYARFGSRLPKPPQQIGIGDQIGISIYETGNGQLFTETAGGASMPNKSTVLPTQTVDRDGKVSVPYAARIQAAGRTPDQVSQAIVEALKSKASEPQAIVSVVQSGTSVATVVGDATGSGRIPLNLKGDRLLEVVSQAGGIRTMPQETYIRLLRGQATGSASMRAVLADPKENIFIYPGDTIYISKNTPKFTVLGAVNFQKDYPIDQDRLTLAEAVARSGGLNDLQADSSAVFLFRYESPDVVRAIKPRSRFLNGPAEIPVVYRMSFRRPSDYFYAQKLIVENNDLLYIANAPVVELTKFVTLARGIAAVGAIVSGSGSIAN